MADSTKYNGSTWEHSLRKLTTATADIEPTIYTDGTAITAYTLKGNTVQNGTPTPSNPVDVSGVGERTENLFDGQLQQGYYAYVAGDYTLANTYVCTHLIPCTENTTYTFRCINTGGGSKNYGYVFFDSAQNRIDSDYINVLTEGDVVTHTATTPQNTAFLAINVAYGRRQARVVRPSDITDFMLNTGSTALPFEPYGFKIPISSAGQTIDIYIGDLPLLKSLDGTAVDEISNGTLTRKVDSDGSVLPTPTTAQITMPSIPTTEGANSITVDTTLQPSEVTATWTGWHDASVKEKSENLAYDILVRDLQAVYSIVLLFDADLEPDTTYTLSFDSTSGFYFYINEQVFNVKYINTVTGRNQVICTTKSTLDKSNNRQYLNGRWIILKNAMGQPTNIDITNVMFNAGSTALPYEPYWK